MSSKDSFNLFSPTDFRYSVRELEPFLSEEAYVKYKARVEAALAHGLAKEGVCSKKIANEIAKACKTISAKEVYEEETRIKHDVRALVNVIRSKVSPKARPFVHLSATSYDIVDTANSLRFKDAMRQVIIPDLLKLEKSLIEICKIHSKTIQVGRTHGQHAEPITFGLYIAYYVSRLGNRIKKIQSANEELAGKFSGAVGAYGPLSLIVDDPGAFENAVLSSLGLKASEVSTQIVEPEAVADLAHAVVSTFGVMSNFARDMRHLQRTEIGEISEEFQSKQVGSSTMPHKRNPISFENVESLWKKFMPEMITIYLDQVSEHQRDLTNSASQRYIPELLVVFDYCVKRLNRTIWDEDKKKSKLRVETENIERNLESSLEEMAAEPLYILLSISGHLDAHEKVRQVVQNSISKKQSFLEALESDDELSSYLSVVPKDKLKFVHNPKMYTGISSEKSLSVAERWEAEFFSSKEAK